MHLGRLRAGRLRGRVFLLLLPLLAFRLLVPDGFMPRFGADHTVSMQMCHGDAGSSAIIHALETPPATPDDGRGQHEAPCVFAALGALATAEPLPAALATSAHADILRQPVVPAPALRITHRSQAPRAPPLTV